MALARETVAAGGAFPRYASPYSRCDYTQAQFLALLAVMQFLRTDYSGVVALAVEWAELRRALRRTRVPHHSTLCYAELSAPNRRPGCMPVIGRD